MYSIWKYGIEPDIVNQVYRMPEGAVILSIGLDPHGKMCFWAQVNTEAELEDHAVACIGTGWDMGAILGEKNRYVNFIGTVVHGEYVWHMFDLGGKVKEEL